MGIFLKRLGILLLLFGGFTQLINFIVPEHYGNFQYVQKLKLFDKYDKQENINTIFLGASNVHRHINPLMFDSYTDGTTNSFNLGTDGTNLLEVYYLLEHFYKKHTAENVIITVHPIRSISKKNKNTYKSAYYNDYKRTKYYWECNKGDILEVDKKGHHLLSAFFENLLGVHKLRNLLKMKQINETIPEFMDEHKGFQSCNNLAGKPRRWSGMQRGKKMGGAHLRASEKDSYDPLTTSDSLYIEIAKEVGELVAKNNGTAYFVFQPNAVNYFRYDIPNSFYMGDDSTFEAFFSSSYRFYPGGHLNDSGADLYSVALAREFKKYLDSPKGK